MGFRRGLTGRSRQVQHDIRGQINGFSGRSVTPRIPALTQPPKRAEITEDPTESVIGVLGLALDMGLPVSDTIRRSLGKLGAPAGDFDAV